MYFTSWAFMFACADTLLDAFPTKAFMRLVYLSTLRYLQLNFKAKNTVTVFMSDFFQGFDQGTRAAKHDILVES